MLDERSLSSLSPVAQFVGKEYGLAGGAMEETLFGDEPDGVRILDPELMTKLATEKLESVLEAEPGEWKWKAAALAWGYEQSQDYEQAHGVPGELTPGEMEEKHELEDKLEAIYEAHETGEMSEEEAWEKGEEIEDRLQQLQELRDGRDVFRPELMAIAGIVATIDREGVLQIMRGLVAKEDAKALRAAQKGDQTANGESGTSKPVKDKLDYSGAVRGDLREMRGAAVKAALADNPRAAQDLLAFTLARSQAVRHYEASALSLSTPYAPSFASKALKDHDSADAALNPPAPPQAAWRDVKGGPEAFAAFLKLPVEDRDLVLSHAVAALLVPTLADDMDGGVGTVQEVAVDALAVDFPARLAALGLTPWDRDLFWNRLTKAQILDAAKTLGKEWGKEHSPLKKGDLATAAANAFAKRDQWLPKGF